MDKEQMTPDARILLLQHRLDTHIDEYQKYREDEDRKWDQLIAVQEANANSIKDLTESTRDVVEVWRATQGTVTVLSSVGRFFKWLSGFAILGVVIKWFTDFF